MNELSKKLRELRKGVGLSQSELAKELLVDAGSISAYERGQNTPRVETLISLSNKFNVSVDWLLGLSAIQSICELHEITFEKDLTEDELINLRFDLLSLRAQLKKYKELEHGEGGLYTVVDGEIRKLPLTPKSK